MDKKRTLVISDIHGEPVMFQQLLRKAKYDPNEDQLILLGDYVDRGPNSRKVLEMVMELKQLGALVLKGNHEDMMIKALTSDEEKPWKHWMRNGGAETLKSYGVIEDTIEFPDDQPFQKPIFQSEPLNEHLQFIQSLDCIIEQDDIIFVHAGLNPEKTIEETDPHELIWIREKFHNGYSGKKTVIFGHTPTNYLHKEDNFTVFFGDNNIIGIDGGAVYGGQLNCLELHSFHVYHIPAERQKEEKKLSAYKALIPERIFFGGIDAIDQLLKEEKIDVIYDLRAEVNGPLASEKSVHQPLLDDAEQQDESIKEAVNKVVKAYNEGKNIYFHCNTGRGRAGTVATATLLELQKATSVDEAEQITKEIRPETNLKLSFKSALKRLYENE